VTFPDRERANPFVARLWATQRIGYLSAERHKHGANPEVDDEIRQLGMRFGIPTELTSYLVQEPQHDVAFTGVAGGVARAAPAMQAFAAAKEASVARAATSLAQVELDSTATARKSEKKVAQSDGRTFWRRDSVWVDSRWRDGMRVVRVKPYSTAYFALLGAVPELKSAFAVGEVVRVAGRAVAIEVAGDGVEKLSDAEVASVRSDW
jgi:Ca-activated chloride channel family protein